MVSDGGGVLAFVREYIPSTNLHFSEARFKSFFIELNKPKKKQIAGMFLL